MGKKFGNDQKISTNSDIIDSPHEEGNNMQELTKEEENIYKGLSLSEKKLKEITISPKI